ncbi:MAG TPA: hypothetical protein ENJ95_00290 [Bacteroidetes bacterium]|nr:hypothetical protein [Bacteroidota bacterium]
MKYLKYLSVFLVAAMLLPFSSCVDDADDGGRFPDLQEAANMRIVVDQDFSSINADDPASAKVVMDFFSENLADIEKVDLLVDFFDFSEGTTTAKTFLKNVPLSSFSDGVMRKFEISFAEFKAALGLEDADFDGLDQINIYNETTMKDGRVYPSNIVINQNVTVNNVTPNIQNSAATTSFTSKITVFVQCPLPDGFATGKYMVEQTAGPSDPFFGNPTRWAAEEVTLEATGPINRAFKGTYLTFTGIQFNFVVTCGTLVVPKGSAGLGCGGAGLNWVQEGVNSYVDDTEFTITILDNSDGDCGIPTAEPLTLKLTKL